MKGGYIEENHPMTAVDVLVAVLREDASRYHKNLSANKDIRLKNVSSK